ncbi:Zn-ribbon domain-containing OB-fold protein [Devosia sp. A369]
MSSEPNLANGDSQSFWAGVRQRKLLLQQCQACSVFQFPPRHHCANCWEGELAWIQSSGTGTIESFTIVRRAPIAKFRARVPYVVVAVRLEEGPRMITNLIGEDALDVQIGDRVQVDFSDTDTGEALPQFRRA